MVGILEAMECFLCIQEVSEYSLAWVPGLGLFFIGLGATAVGTLWGMRGINLETERAKAKTTKAAYEAYDPTTEEIDSTAEFEDEAARIARDQAAQAIESSELLSDKALSAASIATRQADIVRAQGVVARHGVTLQGMDVGRQTSIATGGLAARVGVSGLGGGSVERQITSERIGAGREIDYYSAKSRGIGAAAEAGALEHEARGGLLHRQSARLLKEGETAEASYSLKASQAKRRAQTARDQYEGLEDDLAYLDKLGKFRKRSLWGDWAANALEWLSKLNIPVGGGGPEEDAYEAAGDDSRTDNMGNTF